MRKIILTITKVAFSLGLVAILFMKSDINKLYNTIAHSNYHYFILSFFISLLGLYLATLRWQILLNRFNRKTSLNELFRYICLSLFYNFFIPGGFAGDVVRGFKCKDLYLNSSHGIASVFVDRIIGLASFILFGLVGMLYSFQLLKQSDMVYFVMIVITSSVLFSLIIFNRKIMSYFKILSRLHFTLYERLKEVYNNIYYYTDYKGGLAIALIVSMFATFINILAIFFISVSMGSDVRFVHFIFFVPIITIISYLPISYSGLGIREAGFIFLFTQVGMSHDQALAIPLIYFGLLLILGIMGGIIYILTNQ